MSRCNAWDGEPDPELVWFRCELPKGHEGKHYAHREDLEVYWSKDNRPQAIASKLYFEAACIGYAYNFSLKRKQQMIALANRINPGHNYMLAEEMLPDEQAISYRNV